MSAPPVIRTTDKVRAFLDWLDEHPVTYTINGPTVSVTLFADSRTQYDALQDVIRWDELPGPLRVTPSGITYTYGRAWGASVTIQCPPEVCDHCGQQVHP